MNFSYQEAGANMPPQITDFPKVGVMTDKDQGQRREAKELPTGDINNVSVFGVNAIARFEARVMEAVWALDRQVSVAEILERMQDDEARLTPAGERPKKIAYTSVLTTVTNLAKKGYLSQDRNPADPTSRNAFMYEASMSKGDYERLIAQKLAEASLRIDAGAAMDVFRTLSQESPKRRAKGQEETGK